MIERPDWHSEAACRGKDPDIFFPPQVSHTPTDYAEAKAICATCPVIDQCLAAHRHERHGCWAATSPRDREKMAGRRGVQLWCEGCGAMVVRRQYHDVVWCAAEECQKESGRRHQERYSQRKKAEAS